MNRESCPRLIVVAGLCESPENPGYYLITQRHLNDAQSLRWEFPGGKIERGESPEAALKRELEEELDIEVAVGEIYAVGHDCRPDCEVILLTYKCELVSGQPRSVDVESFKFASVDEIATLPLTKPDLPVLARLLRERKA